MNERLDGTEPQDVIDRHVQRYQRACELASEAGGDPDGVWWDVGCGSGYGLEIMPGKTRIGFDKEPGDVEDETRTVDLTDPDWAKGAERPDVVLCIETLEHLHADEQDDLVEDIADKLKKGGVLVLCCPLGNGPSKVNPWHVHEPTGRELRGLVAKYMELVSFEAHDYMSTSGPAFQAYVVGRAI